MIKLAIFASGSGSNAENIVNYFSNNASVYIDVIISNKPDAYVLERAGKLDIESFVFSKQDFMEPKNILQLLNERRIDFIVLAGFLLKIPEKIITEYSGRIVNIHPALLPKYGGKGMYGDNVHKAVVESGDGKTGITIHFVNDKYDEGDIIFQAECAVDKNDTYDMVARKVRQLEYRYYPEIIEKIIHESYNKQKIK